MQAAARLLRDWQRDVSPERQSAGSPITQAVADRAAEEAAGLDCDDRAGIFLDFEVLADRERSGS
ncbi:hypothetical protein HYE82_24170 [Streptomyces sp. BR123]|uniref:hypothetical protein n=1 Tax=Streptomyces sp. BR123 TaxID=2749828 RepID=UPI0015C413B1|nr:hypothetical protein [Streptomyces sp. BR123]NXY97414.1 hypothetical protein [Streptomyces sp. BR123]